MNYKKLHEDTINRLQQMVSCGKITVEVARGICADFIPESEDEKIRKHIIEILSTLSPCHFDGNEKSECIAWLEKQGEKKPEINDDVLSRFAFYQYDDDAIYLSSLFVRESDRGRGYGSKVLKAAEEVAKIFGISKIRLKVERNTWMEEWYKKNGYEYISFEDKYDWFEKRCEQKFVDKCKDCNNVKGCITCTDGDQYAHITEQKPTDKIEPKFKVGDSIKTANEEPLTITEITDIGYWSEDLFICNFDDADKWELVEKKIETIEIPFGAKDSELMGATYYIPEGFHAEIDGNKVIIKQGEQKPAWSEEDERTVTGISMVLQSWDSYHVSSAGLPSLIPQYVSWLDSLKQRIQPQPEQEPTEEVLNKYINLGLPSALWKSADEEVVNECVDLGLPSGTLWKPFNEEGYYTYNEAIDKFGDNLPTKDQWKELRDNCNWEWQNNGYEVTGPNGNTIFLPAKGYCIGTEVHGVGTYGYYWTSTYNGYGESYAYCMNFYVGDNYIFVDGDCRKYGNSIRLVGKKKGE